jgi:hypothetical protein
MADSDDLKAGLAALPGYPMDRSMRLRINNYLTGRKAPVIT